MTILAFTIGVIVGIALGLLIAGLAFGAAKMATDQATGGAVTAPTDNDNIRMVLTDGGIHCAVTGCDWNLYGGSYAKRQEALDPPHARSPLIVAPGPENYLGTYDH